MNAHIPRARAGLVGLAAVAVLAAAPAEAGTRKTPPPLNVANRGESFKAAMGSYSWCYKQDGYTTCVVADAFGAPDSFKALPARPGDKVVLRPHAKVKSIEVSTVDYNTYKAYPNQPKRVPGKPRVWTLKVAKGIGKRKNLVAFVSYAGQGKSADFGFGIRKAE